MKNKRAKQMICDVMHRKSEFKFKFVFIFGRMYFSDNESLYELQTCGNKNQDVFAFSPFSGGYCQIRKSKVSLTANQLKGIK